MYRAARDGQRVLFFQAANALWLARVVLTNEEGKRWLALLRADLHQRCDRGGIDVNGRP